MNVDRRSFARTLISGTLAVSLGIHRAVSVHAQAAEPIRARIWTEGEVFPTAYPDGIAAAIADGLGRQPGLNVSRSQLEESEAGLSDSVLDATDVLIWWGRSRHDEVPDDRAQAVAARVREGRLGLVALYTACGSKPFRLLMDSMPCEPGSWREDGRPEFVAVKAPDHPIAAGVGPFTIPKTDMFSEPFAVPEPETVVFMSSWERGESVRSGLTWSVGKGRVAYLRIGSEAFPVLFHPSIRLAIANAVAWGARRS